MVTGDRIRRSEHQGQISAIHRAQCVVSFDLNGAIFDANGNMLETLVRAELQAFLDEEPQDLLDLDAGFEPNIHPLETAAR